MKTIILPFSLRKAMLGAAVVLASAGVACAQETTTTTTSAGTIRHFGPKAMTITTSTGPAPVSYSFTKTTTYVDENGNPVSVQTVKSGLPVTVYYTREGDRLVADKVVVKRSTLNPDGSSTTMTTVKSSEGTVSAFNPDTMVVKTTDADAAPVSYAFTKTTTYVDENGNPVSVDVVKSGVPVTVFYDRQGDQMVATKVVVRESAAPDASIIQHKKTTTTTTTTDPNR